MTSLALVVALSLTAPDGGLDVELLDAGTVLREPLVCMPPHDALTLDLGLRSAEKDRDELKTWLIVTPLVALAVGVVAGVLGGLAASHRP